MAASVSMALFRLAVLVTGLWLIHEDSMIIHLAGIFCLVYYGYMLDKGPKLVAIKRPWGGLRKYDTTNATDLR